MEIFANLCQFSEKKILYLHSSSKFAMPCRLSALVIIVLGGAVSKKEIIKNKCVLIWVNALGDGKLMRSSASFSSKRSHLIGRNKRDHLIGQNSVSTWDNWPIKWPRLYWPIREHFSAQLRNWSCYEWHFLIITWWIQFPKFGPNI